MAPLQPSEGMKRKDERICTWSLSYFYPPKGIYYFFFCTKQGW